MHGSWGHSIGLIGMESWSDNQGYIGCYGRLSWQLLKPKYCLRGRITSILVIVTREDFTTRSYSNITSSTWSMNLNPGAGQSVMQSAGHESAQSEALRPFQQLICLIRAIVNSGLLSKHEIRQTAPNYFNIPLLKAMNGHRSRYSKRYSNYYSNSTHHQDLTVTHFLHTPTPKSVALLPTSLS